MRKSMQTPPAGNFSQAMVIAALALAIGALAALFRVGLLNAAPEFDELYHVLAARGWLETGRPSILDGEYTRGLLFTRAVAEFMSLTGSEDVASARLISVAAGSLVPVVLFLWLYRLAGLAPALIASAFAIAWPQSILEAQFVRFYAVQVLAFLTGATAFYLTFQTRGTERMVWAVLTLVAWAFALHVQIASLFGIGGALAWAVLSIIFNRFQHWHHRAILIAGLAVILVLCLAAAAGLGVLQKAWALFRWTPPHAAELRDYVGFYHNQFERWYGILWWLTPFLAAIAFWTRPNLTSYCLAIFGSCFLVHSFGGMKSLRYLSYASPFLFSIWAISAATIAQMLAERVGWKVAASLGVVAAVGLFALNSFASRSVELALGQGLPARGDWRQASDIIDDWASAPFVMTTRELHMVAHVGPYDMLYSNSRIAEIDPPIDFSVDHRTGRPVIGSSEALAAVLDCERSGLLVTSPLWWERNGRMVEDLLSERQLNIDQREDGSVKAVRWGDPASQNSDCGGIPL